MQQLHCHLLVTWSETMVQDQTDHEQHQRDQCKWTDIRNSIQLQVSGFNCHRRRIQTWDQELSRQRRREIMWYCNALGSLIGQQSVHSLESVPWISKIMRLRNITTILNWLQVTKNRVMTMGNTKCNNNKSKRQLSQSIDQYWSYWVKSWDVVVQLFLNYFSCSK